jgi:gliding motility-associated lipoprotein GldH
MQKIFYFFALVSLLSSCGPTVIYEQEKEVPTAGWAYQDSARFDFSIPEADQAYDLVLKLEHGTTFPYQNFYVKLHTGFPSGKRTTEQVSLQLSGDFGTWLGDCNSEVCNQEITILQNAKFAETGKYYLTVEQFSREPVLGSVGSVGLAVLETKELEARN